MHGARTWVIVFWGFLFGWLVQAALRDSKGRVIELRDRRDGNDLVWKRVGVTGGQ